jgi:hypothetical protein
MFVNVHDTHFPYRREAAKAPHSRGDQGMAEED